MKYVKYKGRVYAEVDSTADELKTAIDFMKDRLSYIQKFIYLSKSARRIWESTGDEQQVNIDRKFLKDAEEYAARLTKIISKAQNHLAKKS